MNIIVCVDKQGGMMFNNRRQSQDYVLRARVMELCADARLLMSEYSGLQFTEYSNIMISDDFLSVAHSGDYCFIEDGEVPVDNVENVYIFKWNRDYPADKYFTLDLKAKGFKRIKKEEFKGSSHKKITFESYKKV